MSTKTSFSYPFPKSPEDAPFSAGRIDIPRGTKALRITGIVTFPDQRPEGGMIALLGIRAGAVEGKRKNLVELTLGRRNQWRIAGDATKPEQAGTRPVPFGGEMKAYSYVAGFRLTFDLLSEAEDAVKLETAQGSKIVSTSHNLDEGGVIFFGMDSSKSVEYVPLYGGHISGEVSFEGADEGEERPDDLPPGDDLEASLGLVENYLRSAERWVSESRNLLANLRGKR